MIYSWSLAKRPTKDDVRKLVMEGHDAITGTGSVFLPGYDARTGVSGYDLRMALEKNVVDGKSPVYVAEQDRDLWEPISGSLDGLRLPKLHFHRGSLDRMVFPKNAKVGFVFVDLCGHVSPELLIWMSRHLSNVLVDGARVAVSTLRDRRGSQFLPRTEEKVKHNFGDEYSRVSKRLSLPEDEPNLLNFYLLSSALRAFSFDYHIVKEYGDTKAKMAVYRFSNLKRQDRTPFPAIEDLVVPTPKSARVRSMHESDPRAAFDAAALAIIKGAASGDSEIVRRAIQQVTRTYNEVCRINDPHKRQSAQQQ